MESNPNSRPHIGVGLIVIKDYQVLFLRRKNVHGSGTWSTPGGLLEYGETVEACAARETFEESGITARNIRFIAITNDVFEELNKHYITIWMQGDYDSGEPSVAAPYESDTCGWYPLNDLPQPLFLPLRHLLDGCCYPANAFNLK